MGYIGYNIGVYIGENGKENGNYQLYMSIGGEGITSHGRDACCRTFGHGDRGHVHSCEPSAKGQQRLLASPDLSGFCKKSRGPHEKSLASLKDLGGSRS